VNAALRSREATIVVLDRPSEPLLPYASWLRDSAARVVLLSGRSRSELVGLDQLGYAEVVSCDDYENSAQVERTVFRLAESAPLAAIVATAAADSIRAGALRDELGIPGQGRASAIAFQDLVRMRQLMERAGVPVVPSGPVRRVADLYWCAHRWGFPLRVRHRREPRWPTLAVLEDEAELRSFLRGGLSPRLEAVPSLVAEPGATDDASRVARASTKDGTWWLETPPADGEEPKLVPILHATVAALAPPGGHPCTVELHVLWGSWRVDAVSCRPTGAAGLRELVLAQAGLGPTALEVAR
jgi:hypothetical protein